MKSSWIVQFSKRKPGSVEFKNILQYISLTISTNKQNIFFVDFRRFNSHQGMAVNVFASRKFEFWFNNRPAKIFVFIYFHNFGLLIKWKTAAPAAGTLPRQRPC